MSNIVRSESDSLIYSFNKVTGESVMASKVKTYLGGFCWEIVKGNLKDNSISCRKTVFSFEEAQKFTL